MGTNITKKENKEKRWCILRHADADLIGNIFSGKRRVFNGSVNDTYPLPPFEYFIPFEDLKLRKKKKINEDCPCKEEQYRDYDAMLDEQALRCDLHHFIFICEPKEVVLRILESPWNRALSHRLFAYRDENGDPVEISNAEMERFKTVIKRYDFQIINGEPTDEVREGDQVTVVSGPMTGTEGVVKQIRERKGQILLTVAFTMFQDKMRVAVPGIPLSDVRLNSPEQQQLLQDPVISHFEDELIELLCHLHGKKGSQQLNRDDQKRLRFLYQYSDILFEDNAEAQAKFSALMLICAYLMNDKDEVQRRLKEVETLLANRSPENSQFSILNSPRNATLSKREFTMELEIYLLISLFIVNHNPELRQQAKAWRQAHPDCPLSIRRLLSIAKQIRC